jgi:hypothetical protein
MVVFSVLSFGFSFVFLLVGDISCEQGVLGGTVEMIFIGNGRRFRFNKGYDMELGEKKGSCLGCLPKGGMG